MQTCILIVLSVICQHSFAYDANSVYCSRIPAELTGNRMNGDNGYQLQVQNLENNMRVSTFQPNKIYKVVLFSEEKNNYFEGFIVAAIKSESANGEEIEVSKGILTPDEFYSERVPNCERNLRNIDRSIKKRVEMKWESPSDNECIQIKSTVIASYREKKWYGDDRLVVTICGTYKDNDAVLSNPKIVECVACGQASYRLRFNGKWDSSVHEDMPEEYLAKWMALVGASHNENFKIFEFDKVATTEFASSLYAHNFSNQLASTFKKASNNIRTVIKISDLPSSVGSGSAQFSTTPSNHLVSFIAIVTPSPDWFVGINSQDMCEKSTDGRAVWVKRKVYKLYPIDGGIDNGIKYSQARSKEIPLQQIKPAHEVHGHNKKSSLYSKDNNKGNPFAELIIELTKINNPNKCESQNAQPSYSGGSGCVYSSWTIWYYDGLPAECKQLKCDVQVFRTRAIKTKESNCKSNKHLVDYKSCRDLQPKDCQDGDETEEEVPLSN